MSGDWGRAELERAPLGYGGRFYGVYPATVVDVADPDGEGRVKVELPWAPDDDGVYEVWARLATMMAGASRGSWFIPDVGDEVLVSFIAGDPRLPCVVGALWNGQDAPPESMDGGGQNNLKALHSRNGIVISMDDSSGQEKLTLKTPGGHEILLDDGGRSITVTDSNGNKVTMEAAGVTVDTAAKVTVNAGATVEVTGAMVKVNAGMSQFSGVVQCNTLIATTVVGTTYTPGAGNIL